MKKQILNFGKTLSRAEQKNVFGSKMLSFDETACLSGNMCEVDSDCPGSCTCGGGPLLDECM